MLPHRYPFLMVDRIVGFEGETKCTGVKSVTINEPYFPGPFPRPSGHARRAAGGGDGAGGEHPDDADHQEREQDRLLHERGRGEVSQAGFPGDTLFIHVELTKRAATASPRRSAAAS